MALSFTTIRHIGENEMTIIALCVAMLALITCGAFAVYITKSIS